MNCFREANGICGSSNYQQTAIRAGDKSVMTFDLRQSLLISPDSANCQKLEELPVVLVSEFSSEFQINLCLVSEEASLAWCAVNL